MRMRKYSAVIAPTSPGGAIAGTITKEEDGQPQWNAWVEVFDPAGDRVGIYQAPRGQYLAGGLPAFAIVGLPEAAG